MTLFDKNKFTLPNLENTYTRIIVQISRYKNCPWNYILIRQHHSAASFAQNIFDVITMYNDLFIIQHILLNDDEVHSKPIIVLIAEFFLSFFYCKRETICAALTETECCFYDIIL